MSTTRYQGYVFYLVQALGMFKFNMRALEKVTIPTSLKSIGEYAGCSALVEVAIPNMLSVDAVC